MSEQRLRELAAELGSSPPAGLAALEEGEVHDLTLAIREVRRRQAAELVAAGERSLAHVPKLLRAPVRRVVGMGR